VGGYEVFGGPCHFDIKLHFLVGIGPDLMKSKGYVDADGNKNATYDANASNFKKASARRLKSAFDKFFNPQGPDAGKLYTFPPERPCCNFHLDADFEAGDPSLDGQNERNVRNAMQSNPGKTYVEMEKLGEGDHPHADIGGQFMQLPDVSMDDQGLHSLPHEIGHILGLADQYKTSHNRVSPQEEREHLGHLMGKSLPGGQREVDSHEAGEIAANAGLTCDFNRCCPRQAHPLHGQHEPAHDKPQGESKSLKTAYCVFGLPSGDWQPQPETPNVGRSGS
jgi:hypothetical protein